MRVALGVVIGAALGGFLGYMLAVMALCSTGIGGNLCGLFGVFITGPLGAVAGAIAGWRFRRS